MSDSNLTYSPIPVKPTHQTSQATPYKQEHFRYILKILIPVWRSVRARNYWACQHPIFYVDLYAGAGRSPDDDSLGSPLIFSEETINAKIPIEAHFYERDLAMFASLAENMKDYPGVLHCADNHEILTSNLFPKKRNANRYGLVYLDPPGNDGGQRMDEVMKLAQKVALSYARVDILINYSATIWKRMRDFSYYQNIIELLNTIPKQHRLIRAPYKQHQWTMLLFTNWLAFPKNENLKWYGINSPEGKATLEQVAYSQNERDAK